MFDDWIEVLLRGSYQIDLPTLTVNSGQVGGLRGSGSINWDSETGIRVQAVTDGGQTIGSVLFGRSVLPGTLIPHSTFLTFSGRTQNGWNVSTFPASPNGNHLHSAQPEVVWNLPVHGVTLERTTTGDTVRLLRILMGPVPNSWPRVTPRESTNEFFGTSGFTRDWLATTTSIGRVAAQQRSDDWFEVRVFPDDNQPMGDPFEVTTVIARAFGFVLGRRCVVRGHEEYNLERRTRRLDNRYRETSTNGLLAPLGWQMEFLQNVERLLGRAIDFFLTDLGEQVAPFLHICWYAADNVHQTQLAMSSICLEGLLRLAAETLGPTQPQVDAADIAAFQAWLRTSPAGFTPQFLNRLNGITGIFRNLSTNEIFRDWMTRGVLGVSRDDFQAWNDTRNPIAHGRVGPAADQAELQTRVSRHDRIQNLMNRIILQMMGYTGVYIDYAQRGHPPADFPAVVPHAAEVVEATSPASQEPPPPDR